MSGQRFLFDVPGADIPPEILRLLSPDEIEFARTMPEGAQWARIVGWLRRNPQVVPLFIAETKFLLNETPYATVTAEEVLCRMRRRHGIKIWNEKGFFSRWLPRLVPEMLDRMSYRVSKFASVMAAWKGRE